ncbi:MAG: thiamine phosphate synthase [Verrucomicrobia bacterium]|nr:thiamine phosphate synthase [Verrucomicrobiota bacterium]
MLSSACLYGILDLGYVAAAEAEQVTRELLEGGVEVLQLRAKGVPAAEVAQVGRRLAPICRAQGVPFILNDHPELVAACGADGAHIGQDDGPLATARDAAGPGALIGRSTHSLAQVEAALAEGADYLGFGPLFATPTKPTYVPIGLEDIAAAQTLAGDRPIFCIGGVKLENLSRLRAAGARRVVIVSGLLQAPDRRAYARACRSSLRFS